MPFFQKKPVVIEAWEYKENGFNEANGVPLRFVHAVCRFCKQTTKGRKIPAPPHLHTIHAEQIVILEDGDWIIPESDGKHFYPCKPDIFEQSYDPLRAVDPVFETRTTEFVNEANPERPETD